MFRGFVVVAILLAVAFAVGLWAGGARARKTLAALDVRADDREARQRAACVDMCGGLVRLISWDANGHQCECEPAPEEPEREPTR